MLRAQIRLVTNGRGDYAISVGSMADCWFPDRLYAAVDSTYQPYAGYDQGV